jgi:ADP-ribosyl-[dinitrogen reductase] hydrolase
MDDRSVTRPRTSVSHPLWVDSMSVPGLPGLIGMTICPGKKGDSVYGPPWDRDLRADVGVIRAWGAAVVVTLMESHEFELLGVTELGAEVERAGMRWLHLPIPDLGAPGEVFLRSWRERGPELHDALACGEQVLLHCRGGLGRTGTIAAQPLIERGMRPEDAIREVRRTRPGAIETGAQERYLRGLMPG